MRRNFNILSYKITRRLYYFRGRFSSLNMPMKRIILIIDDDIDDCQFLQEMLAEAGWKGNTYFRHEAGSALLMLKNMQESESLPSLIILDLILPGIGGMDLLKTIKLLYPTIPVLMYSTTCDDELTWDARKHGAMDCLKKVASHEENLRFAKHLLSLISQPPLH